LSFIGYVEGAQTDLEGLVYFDTNQDGVFNSSDADWSKFGVWQDFDQDGTTDDGEFHSLDVVGINAISLTSDNSQRTYGSNVVHGFGSYSVVGGGTGTFADASLAASNIGFRKNQDGSIVAAARPGLDVFFDGQFSNAEVDLGNLTSIAAYGFDGDDKLSSGTRKDTLLDGGEGNDTV